MFLLSPSHPSPSCLCWGVEVNHSPAVLPGASTRGLPQSFRASAVTFRGCCDVKNFIPLPTRNGCQGQRAETVFHGLGVYFGAYPGGWEESCPWVMLGIFKYTGPEIQCPGAPRLNQHGSLRAAVGCISWLGARITYGVFSAGRVCGGGWRWGNTSVVQMRAAKSFRNEGRAHESVLAGLLPLSVLDPTSIPIPFSSVGAAGASHCGHKGVKILFLSSSFLRSPAT